MITNIKDFLSKTLEKFLFRPIFLSIFSFIFLSGIVLIIDHSTIAMKINTKLGVYVAEIDKLLSSEVLNYLVLYSNKVKHYFFIDTNIIIPELSINTDDTTQRFKKYLYGYVRGDLLIKTDNDNTNINYLANNPHLPLPIPGISDAMIHPYKIITSDPDSTLILNEIFDIAKNNTSIETIIDTSSVTQIFFPPSYLKSSPN